MYTPQKVKIKDPYEKKSSQNLIKPDSSQFNTPIDNDRSQLKSPFTFDDPQNSPSQDNQFAFENPLSQRNLLLQNQQQSVIKTEVKTKLPQKKEQGLIIAQEISQVGTSSSKSLSNSNSVLTK